MIKNLEKDLRTYRKDTFITSFFATLTILLIVLIICSVPSHAQEINGGDVNNDTDYSYDTDNYYGLGYYFKGLDITKTDPQGCLYRDGNPLLEQNSFDGGLYADAYNLSSSYACIDAPITLYNNILNGQSVINIPSEVVYNGTTYNIKDYNKFIFTSDGQTLDLCLFKEDTVYLTFSSANIFWINSPDAIIFNYPNSAGTGNPSVRIPAERHIAGSGVDNNVYVLSNSNHSLVYANCSVLGDLYEYPDTWTRNVSYFSAEYNYLNGQVGNGGSGSGETSENADNNLVLEESDWIFSNKDYYAPYCKNGWYDKVVTNSVYPNGNITYTFIPNDYQIAHSSEFNLVFSFSWDYNVNYKNQKGGDANKPFETTLLKQKNFVSSFQYYNNGTDLSYIEVPLSTFISNNNSMSWTFKEVMDKLYYNNYLFPDVLTLTNKPYPDNKDFVDVYSYNKFQINATVFLDTVGGGNSSGNYTEFYNPMNREGGTSDDSGTINKNPYNNNSDVSTPGDAPGAGGSNVTNIVHGSNVTIYNTNNNNNTNTVAADSNTFKNVFESMIDGNKVTSEDLAESTGTNGFITFMNETFSAVPVTFFTSLLTFFVTCLAILIIAFVLRMLLDIL